MPESRRRRRDDYTPPTAKPVKIPRNTQRLILPVALTLLLLGLAWIVVFYLAGSDVPVMRDLGNYNLLIGMGLITGGFITLTRWK